MNDLKELARKLLIEVNEVSFKDETLYAYCDVTRLIEVSKDLPEITKMKLVLHCLNKCIKEIRT